MIIINEANVRLCIQRETEAALRTSTNTEDVQRQICKRLKKHPLIEDIYTIFWPFNTSVVCFQVKLIGKSSYQSISVDVKPSYFDF